MKEIITSNYKKKASFEGRVLTPEMEDEFVGDIEIEREKRKRNNFYSKGVPSAYKARHPYMVSVDRDTHRGLVDLGRERGYVEDSGDISRKLTRIQKAIERDQRLNLDRNDFYNQLSQDELQRISDDVEKYERENPGEIVTDSMLRMLLKRMTSRKNLPSNFNPRPVDYAPVKKKKLEQLNRRVSYTIDDEAEIELSEENEVTTILNLLHFLDSKINDFASERGVDPESLKEFLGL